MARFASGFVLFLALLVMPSAVASVSPGGTIAFFGGPIGQLYKMRADMTNVQLVAGDVGGLRPASFSLSPDASTIAFGDCSCVAGLATIRVDGTDLRDVPGTTAADSDPAWSPDSTRFAFTHYTGASVDVVTMSVDGSGRLDLTRGYPQYVEDPRWSPNGSEIVFWGSAPDGGLHLYTVNADGTNLTQITQGDFQDRQPTWSPQGDWIAFGRNSYSPVLGSGPSNAWVVRPDGSDAQQITFAGGAGAPEWSPSGDLSYSAGNGLVVLSGIDESSATFFPGPPFFYYDWQAGDTQPPTITCSAPDNQWHSTNISLACTATDSGSGLANTADASFNLSTSVPADSETSNASTNIRHVCDEAGNCAVAGPINGLKVDQRSPTVTCSATSLFSLNQSAAVVSATVADDGSGPSAAPITATADTSAPGTHTLPLVGVDNVGNATAVACPYVVTYRFSGFQPPVNSPPTVNTGKAGRTYPVKWQLIDAAGSYISSLSAVNSVTAKTTSCAAFSTDPTDALETSTTGGLSLRYDSSAHQFIYNWATPSAGCYTLFLNFNDGQSYPAFFKLS